MRIIGHNLKENMGKNHTLRIRCDAIASLDNHDNARQHFDRFGCFLCFSFSFYMIENNAPV